MPVDVRVRLRRKALVRQSAVRKLAQVLLDAVGESQSELGVELIGDRRMRRLNRQYRGKDATTDVLAFALREAPGPSSSLMGDVVISVPALCRQAIMHRHSMDRELAVLLIHGILHLCGYDHERGGTEARRMRQQERRLLQALEPLPRLIAAQL